VGIGACVERRSCCPMCALPSPVGWSIGACACTWVAVSNVRSHAWRLHTYLLTQEGRQQTKLGGALHPPLIPSLCQTPLKACVSTGKPDTKNDHHVHVSTARSHHPRLPDSSRPGAGFKQPNPSVIARWLATSLIFCECEASVRSPFHTREEQQTLQCGSSSTSA
jgi:hypothetical protein